MSFRVQGKYFEACTCEVSCPCVFLAPATEDACDLFIAWHVEQGECEGVSLDGLNAALAVRAPKKMIEGNWTLALYLDERATLEQADPLGAVFSGRAGGHLANLGPLVGSVAGISTAPIEFSGNGSIRSIRVGDVLEAEVEQTTGMDGTNPATIANAPLGAVTQPLRQGRSHRVRYDGFWSTEITERNAFLTEFRYEG